MNEYFTVSIQRLKGDTKRLPLETEHNLCCKWNIGDKLAKLKFENSVSNLAQKCKEFEKVSFVVDYLKIERQNIQSNIDALKSQKLSLNSEKEDIEKQLTEQNFKLSSTFKANSVLKKYKKLSLKKSRLSFVSNQLEDVAPEDKEEEKECKCPNTHSDEIMFASKLCSLQNEVAALQSNLTEKQKEYNQLERKVEGLKIAKQNLELDVSTGTRVHLLERSLFNQ